MNLAKSLKASTSYLFLLIQLLLLTTMAPNALAEDSASNNATNPSNPTLSDTLSNNSAPKFNSLHAPLSDFINAAPAIKQDTYNSNNDNTNNYASVDQAFQFNFHQHEGVVSLEWKIKPTYYLYQERFSFKANDAHLGQISLPTGTPHHDEFFGDVLIYESDFKIDIPLVDATKNGKLIVQYQGCVPGFCYPVEEKVVPLDAFVSSNTATTESTAQTSLTTAEPTQTTSSPQSSTSTQATESVRQSEDAGLASQLADNWWAPLLFLIFGAGLALTPCVFPMYPILTSIVLGNGKISTGRAFKLAFVYVQGMALTYTLLGLVVASVGVQFQAAMQHPAILISLSLLFIVLASSMFGAFNLQLPSRLQTWVHVQSNKHQGGNLFGVFSMGAISGLVCSPCTTAPLSGALLYVAQSGDLITGSITLYALALGMGIPLIIVAVFGNKLLPEAGEWMVKVKMLFGFILLAAPLFLLERIVPEQWMMLLWSALGLSFFTWLYHIQHSDNSATNGSKWANRKKTLFSVIAILGLVSSFLVGLQNLGIKTPLTSHNTAQPKVTLNFIQITNLDELNAQLLEAKQQNKAVMLDYYADWCVACKEFDKYTFHEPEVFEQLNKMVLLQIDMTSTNDDNKRFMQERNVKGLPTIEFWNAKGHALPAAKISGFINAKRFTEHLKVNGIYR